MSKIPRNRLNGWINLNKPLEISSANAVNKVKWLLRPEKIGHAGTLDPLATGVLPLALGEGTKCVNLLMDARKTYEFTIALGERRNTDDAEGEVIATSEHIPTRAEIEAVLLRFTGPISQVPPPYSAIKVNGERAYALARAGEEVVLKAREVTIYSLEILDSEIPPPRRGKLGGGHYWGETLPTSAPLQPSPSGGGSISLRAIVSKGTYIRSLGRDIAQAAGSEGYISRLHRSAVGPFTDASAISLDFLEKSVHNAAPIEISSILLPLRTALDDIPAHALDGEQHRQMRHGQTVILAKPIPPAALVAVMFEGELVALARTDGISMSPIRLLHP